MVGRRENERFRLWWAVGKTWVQPVLCDRRNKGFFWAFLEMRRNKAKVFNSFRISMDFFF
jgi:hypothetical protein